MRPSSECATSCSSFEWIRARFAGTTTAFDARFGGADGAGASAWTLAASAATGGAARGRARDDRRHHYRRRRRHDGYRRPRDDRRSD